MVKSNKPSKQEVWVTEQFQDYITKEGVEDAYLRGLHYFIVSKAEDHRQIPTSKANTRLYDNTKNEYKNLSRIVGNARLKGLISFEALEDHKNEELRIGVDERTPASIFSITLQHNHYSEAIFRNPVGFDAFIDSISYEYQEPHFNNQTHRMVLIIEKSKAKSSLMGITDKYGTDFIQFGGQHSLTRLYEICKLAKNEDKPLKVFYISDLDVAGWTMPDSAMERIQEIYPHDEHEMFRVALTRLQAEEHGFPPSFDPDDKSYPAGQVKRFRKESGSKLCIEVDAVPRPLLMSMVESKLKEHACLEEDQEEFNDFCDLVSEVTEELDFTELRERYEAVEAQIFVIGESITESLKKINDADKFYWELHEIMTKIKKEIQETVKEAIEKEE